MRIALVQNRIPSDKDDALRRGVAAIRRAADAGARLVAFPELTFSPFFPQYRRDEARQEPWAESLDGPLVGTIRNTAAACGVVVVMNFWEQEGARRYDSSPVIDADGSLLGKTRMAHITDYRLFYEQDYYEPGDTLAPVYDTSVGRLGIAICYDRHFPEYFRSLALQKAELVIIPQAGIHGEWPQGLYESEIQVASFQNGFFCAMVNRIGTEDQMAFCGSSLVTTPSGEILAQAPHDKEVLLLADINLSTCSESPGRRLFLKHRRPGLYQGGAVRFQRSQRGV